MATKSNSQRVIELRKKRKENVDEKVSSSSTTLKNSEKVKMLRDKKTINIDTFESDITSLSKTINSVYNGWQTKETMENTLSSVQSMYDRIGKYQEYQKQYGGADLSELQNSYKEIIDNWDSLSRDYGKYTSADAYNKAVKNAKAQTEKMRTADIGALDKEISSLRGIYEKANEYKKNLDKYKSMELTAKSRATNLNGMEFPATKKAEADLNSYLKSVGYSNLDDLKKELGEKEVFKTNAERMQNAIKLTSVGDINSENYDKDYNKYVESGKSVSVDDIGTTTEIRAGRGRRKVNKTVNSLEKEVALAYERRQNGEKSSASDTWANDKGALYDKMTDKEFDDFFYYYAKDMEDGGNRTEEYMDAIADTLNSRRGEDIAKSVADSTWGEGRFSITSGLNQWMQGYIGNFAGEEYTPTSPIQYASGMVRENLEEDYGKVARTMYDLGVTGANQLPSILASTIMSYATGGAYAVGTMGAKVMSGISKGVGLATMGASARGNAYTEMINLGYNKDQANTYANLVSASEVGLQALLGGISKLGGTSAMVSKMVDGIDNGLARFAIKYPLSMASEATEEGLQEILNPLFQNIAAGYDTGAEVDWSEVAYSALLGGLMGGMFEGPGLAVNSVAEHYQNKGIGKTIKANERVGDLFDLANNPDIKSAYDTYTRYANKGITTENVSDAKLGRLYSMTETEAKEILASKTSTEEQRTVAQKTLDALGVYSQQNIVSRTGSAQNINKKAFKDYDAEAIVNLIESGLESGENTDANRLATEYKSKIENYDALAEIVTKKMNGEKLTAEETQMLTESKNKFSAKEIASLMDANDRAIRDEENADISAKLVENGVGEEVAALVARKMRGETLTKEESEMILESKEALSFISETTNADNVTAEVIEKAQAMDNVEGALFVSLYDGKTDVEAYTTAFNVVASKASDSFTLEDVLAYKGVLSNVQATKIYNDLRISKDKAKRVEFQKLAERTANLKAYKGNIDDSVIDYANKSTKGKVNWASLPDETRKAVVFFKGIAQATGMNLKFITDGKAHNINGSYTVDGNTITIDLFAESFDIDARVFLDSIVPTMSHELTHWMEKKSPELFRKVCDIVFSTLRKKDGLTESERISREIEKKLSKEYKGKKIPADVLANALTDSKRISVARSEIVARACEDMLSQSKVGKELFNSLNETEKKTLIEKIKDIINDFLNWVDEALGFYKATSYEATILREYKEEFNKLSALWDEMLTESVEVNQALEKSGVFGNDVTSIGTRDMADFSEAVGTDGEKLFQYRAMVEDEDIYRAMLLKHKDTIGITNAQINELFTTIDKAVDIISENLEALDYAWEADINDRAFSPVKPNSDSLYKVSLDFSTLCRKRLLQQTIAQTLQNALDKNLSTEESIAIRDELLKVQEEGRRIEVACALCYVESARMKSPKQINKFLNGRESIIKEFFANRSGGSIKEKIANAEMKARKALAKANPDGYYGKNDVKLDVLTAPKSHMKKADADYIREEGKKAKASYKLTEHEQAELDSALKMGVDDFTSAKGLENLAKNHPDLFDAYTSFVRNATHSKGIENDTWWRAGDAESIGDSLIEKMNEENGLRSQSWSDFQVIHLLDYIAATIELSTKGAKRQSYTKVPDYVKLLGNTGDMINMSLIPARKFNGKLEYDSVEGMAYDIAMQLRDEYHGTVGTICIGINNEQISMLLDDATIDMVIPYHHSSMSKAVRKLMHIPAWETYQNYQNEKKLSDAEAKARAKEYGFNLNKDSNYQKAPNFSEWFNLEEARQIAKLENANPTDMDAYKKYGKMYGGYMAMRNAANKYLKLCAERGLAPKFASEKADFTHDANYWKLLIDRKMVDNVTGEIIEQRAIKPIFNEKHVLEILNDELARYPEVKADQEYATRKVTEKFLSGEMKVDKSTLEAIKKPIDNVTKVNILESVRDGEVLNSERDSEGNALSNEQVEFYKDSKARNAEGNLLTLYHGTASAGFTKFNPSLGRYGGSWFTTSRIDADSYAGNYQHKLFNPSEQNDIHSSVGGNFSLNSEMRFDSAEDLEKFKKANPGADKYLTDAEIYELMEKANKDGDWDEYDRLEEYQYSKERESIKRAYSNYEWEHSRYATVGEIIENPDAFSVTDLIRAYDSIDSNNMARDSLEEGATKEDLVESLRRMEEEAGEGESIADIKFKARLNPGERGTVENYANNRTYACYVNAVNPYEINADGNPLATNGLYAKIEKGMKDASYDSVIVRNARVGANQELGDVVVIKEANQVNLTTNTNPTLDDDILYSERYDENSIQTALWDAFDHNDKGKDNLIKVSKMPNYFVELLGIDGDFYIYRDHAYENMVSKEQAELDGRPTRRKGKDINFHNLGIETMTEAMLAIENPSIAIADEMAVGNPAIFMILPVFDENEVPLCGVVSFYSDRIINGSFSSKPHILLTIHKREYLEKDLSGRQGLVYLVNRAIKEGRIVDFDRKKIRDDLSVIAQRTRLGNITEKSLNANLSQFRKKVNEFREKNNILYSERDDIDVYDLMDETERINDENAKLDADAMKLKGIIGTEEIANKRILGLANYLKKISGSTIDSAILGKRLKEAYSSMQSSEALTWETVASLTHSISESIMSNDTGVSTEYFKRVMYEIRKDKISLSEEQRARMEERFGNYGNFHKYVFGRVNVTKDGVPLEKAWKSWSKKYPSLFNENVSEADQIDALVEAVDALKATSSIMGEYEHQEAIRHLTTEIYNQFWNIAADASTSDNTESVRSEHKALMTELRKDYEKRQKDIATHPIGETALRYESFLKKVQERKKKEIARAKAHGKEMMDKYKENAERKSRIQSITSASLSLNEYLLKNSKDKHIPEIMKEPVTALLQAIDFSSKRMLEKGEPTQKDISLSKALSKVKDMMVKATNAHNELVELYGHGLDEDIEKMVDSVDNIMRTIGDNEFVLNRMSNEDLHTLDKVVKTIRHAVNKLNKFHIVNHAKGIANLSMESVLYLDSLGKAKIHDGMRGKTEKLLNWGNALPYYAFKKYGNGGMKVYEALQDGWDKFAFNTKQILDYANEAYTSNEVKEWSEEVKTFKVLIPANEFELASDDYVPQYQEVQLTVPQIMSMYCLNKREQARGHLFKGGIRVADFKAKKGEVISQSEGIIFTEKDIANILNSLTGRQKAVADKLQEFMNTVSTDWGNEVSMARFGYKAFGEENYFPIQSDGNNLAVNDATEQANSLFRLLNMSFTKSTVDDANNRIVISDIFDVFAQHTSDMAKYNALALPVLDAFKWYNFTEKQDVAEGTFKTKGVKQSIENAFGKDGQSYFTTFLKDINGQHEVSRDTLGKSFFTNAKIAAVGLNLRVVALQPTSYARASAVIDNKYLTKALGHKPKIDKAEKYCGIALWKSMGYYDTNIQRGVEAQIKHADTWKDKATEWSMKGAEMADKLTWGYLWNACELEIRDTRKDLKVGSKEFYEAIGKRLREIIYATQVVDSTMTRSQMMRSSDGYDKMLTSFASEPTLSYNMLQDAYMQYKLDERRMGRAEAIKKNGKRIGRILYAYTMTNAVAALVESAFDAFRDDDDEEMDMIAFMKLYFKNFALDMSIGNKIPFVKELYSLLQGYSSSRLDTQWAQYLYSALNAKKPSKIIGYSIRIISQLGGIPFYNAYRDLMALLNKLDLFTEEDLNEMFGDFED